MGRHVMITGATGMIGALVLNHCLESPQVSSVTSLVRRSTEIQHDKLSEVIVKDFMALDGDAAHFESIDTVFYCIGVYTGAVDRDRFRQITVDYPEALAKKLQHTSPGLTFCLLSGAGADRTERSRMMFAKDKGIIENRLSKMGFKAFYAFRPGYIYPVVPRKEPNFSYKAMRWLYPAFKWLGTGFSITSADLATAIFKVGIDGSDQEVLENKDILEKARIH